MSLFTRNLYVAKGNAGRISQMAERRMQEDAKYERWRVNSRYFKTADVASHMQDTWASAPACYNHHDSSASSTSRTKEINKEEKIQRLIQRRLKLRELIEYEDKEYADELKLLSPDKRKEMKHRADMLKSARETRRKEIVERKLDQQWKENCPQLREVESRCRERKVIENWATQIEKKKQRDEQERQEREEYEAKMERERQLLIQREEDELNEKKKSEELRLKVLQEQIEEVKAREKEALQLEQQHADVIRQQSELERADEMRKQMELEQKKKEFRRCLLHQAKAQLRRKCQEIQKSLELDIKILNDLAISEREDLVRAKEKKERERLEAEEMREIMKQQLELEKQREAELELLYRDEAARSWEMREAEWEKEKLAREALMVEVLAARQQQLEEKKVELMDRRMESIQRREELLKDIEIANQLTAREAEKKCQEKNKIQNELQAQIIAKQRSTRDAELKRQHELHQQRINDEEYDKRVLKETALLTSRYHKNNYGYY